MGSMFGTPLNTMTRQTYIVVRIFAFQENCVNLIEEQTYLAC